MSKSSITCPMPPLRSVIALAVIYFVHQPGYGLETTDAPVTKQRQRTLFDRQLGQFDVQTDPTKPNPCFEDLSDIDKGHLEELWKAILNAPAAAKLRQRTSASLYDFEKEYWRIFDNVILRRRSFTAAKLMGMSLTEASLEPDYPRYGEQSVPYNFGKVYSRRVSGSGTAIGAAAMLGASRHSLDPLSYEITEVLKTLVINYKSYKNHLKDVESSTRDYSRRALADLAGEKAVSEMETRLRSREVSPTWSPTPKLRKPDISIQSLSGTPEPDVPAGFPPLPQTLDLPKQSQPMPYLYPSERPTKASKVLTNIARIAKGPSKAEAEQSIILGVCESYHHCSSQIVDQLHCYQLESLLLEMRRKKDLLIQTPEIKKEIEDLDGDLLKLKSFKHPDSYDH